MLLTGFPSNTEGVQVFTSPGGVWKKPPGKTMLYVLCLSGGGGGAGGFSASAGNGRGGGAGGQQGNYMVKILPLIFLPDILYATVGKGGVGGAAGAAGGTPAYTSFGHNIDSTTEAIVLCGNKQVTGTASPGTGSAGGTCSNQTKGTFPWGGYGLGFVMVSNSGITFDTGGAGGFNANGANQPHIRCGGGGAGTTSADFAGGALAIWDSYPTSLIQQIRPRTPVAGSNNGNNGFTLWKPFMTFGGTGGSSSNTGVGGNGGNGGYGAGGGGGGGGTTGGRGGDGGDGLVITVVW